MTNKNQPLHGSTKEHTYEEWLVCLTYKGETNEYGAIKFDHYPTKEEIDGALEKLVLTHPSLSPKVWQIKKETKKIVTSTDIYTEWRLVDED